MTSQTKLTLNVTLTLIDTVGGE